MKTLDQRLNANFQMSLDTIRLLSMYFIYHGIDSCLQQVLNIGNTIEDAYCQSNINKKITNFLIKKQ